MDDSKIFLTHLAVKMAEEAVSGPMSELKVIYVDSKITVASACPSHLQLDVQTHEDTFTDSETTDTNADDAVATPSPNDPVFEPFSTTINEFVEDLQDDDIDANRSVVDACNCVGITKTKQESTVAKIRKNETNMISAEHFFKDCLCSEEYKCSPMSSVVKSNLDNRCTARHQKQPRLVRAISNTVRLARDSRRLRQQQHQDAAGSRETTRKDYRRRCIKSVISSKPIQCVLKLEIKRSSARKLKSRSAVGRVSGTKPIVGPPIQTGSASRSAVPRVAGEERQRSRRNVLVLAMSTESVASTIKECEDESVAEPGAEAAVGAPATAMTLDETSKDLRRSRSFHGPFLWSTSGNDKVVLPPSTADTGHFLESGVDGRLPTATPDASPPCLTETRAHPPQEDASEDSLDSGLLTKLDDGGRTRVSDAGPTLEMTSRGHSTGLQMTSSEQEDRFLQQSMSGLSASRQCYESIASISAGSSIEELQTSHRGRQQQRCQLFEIASRNVVAGFRTMVVGDVGDDRPRSTRRAYSSTERWNWAPSRVHQRMVATHSCAGVADAMLDCRAVVDDGTRRRIERTRLEPLPRRSRSVEMVSVSEASATPKRTSDDVGVLVVPLQEFGSDARNVRNIAVASSRDATPVKQQSPVQSHPAAVLEMEATVEKAVLCSDVEEPAVGATVKMPCTSFPEQERVLSEVEVESEDVSYEEQELETAVVRTDGFPRRTTPVLSSVEMKEFICSPDRSRQFGEQFPEVTETPPAVVIEPSKEAAVKVTAMSTSVEPIWFDVPKTTQDVIGGTIVKVLDQLQQKDFMDCISASTVSEDEAVTATQWSDEDGATEEPQTKSWNDTGVFSAEAPVTDGSSHPPSPQLQLVPSVRLKTAYSGSNAAAAVELPTLTSASPSLDLDGYGAIEALLQQILTSVARETIHSSKWSATTDFFLRCEGQVFAVHRLIIVHYSERLCDLLHQGSLQPGRTLVIDGVSPAALKDVIYWMYTGRIDLERVNIMEVLLVALGLGIAALQELCTKRLADSMRRWRPSNCHDSTSTISSLTANAEAAHFDNFVREDSYLDCTIDRLCRLLSYDTVAAESEYHVYKAAVLWLAHQWPQRSRYIGQVMGQVRFLYMDTETLQRLLNHDVEDLTEQEILSSREMKDILQESLLCKCYSLERQQSDSHQECPVPPRRFLAPECVNFVFASEAPSVISMTSAAAAAVSARQSKAKTEELLETRSVTHRSATFSERPPTSMDALVRDGVTNGAPQQPLMKQQQSAEEDGDDVHKDFDWVDLLRAVNVRPSHHWATEPVAEDRKEPVTDFRPDTGEAVQATTEFQSYSVLPEEPDEDTGLMGIDGFKRFGGVSQRKTTLFEIPETDVWDSGLENGPEGFVNRFWKLEDVQVGVGGPSVVNVRSPKVVERFEGGLRRGRRKGRRRPAAVVMTSHHSVSVDTTEESEELLVSLEKSLSADRSDSPPRLSKRGGRQRRRDRNKTDMSWRTLEEEVPEWMSAEDVVSGSDYDRHTATAADDACLDTDWSLESNFGPRTYEMVDDVGTVDAAKLTEEGARLTDSDDLEALLSFQPEVHGAETRTARKRARRSEGARHRQTMSRSAERAVLCDRIGSDDLLTITKAKTATVTTFAKKSDPVKAKTTVLGQSAATSRCRRYCGQQRRVEIARRRGSRRLLRNLNPTVGLSSSWASLGHGGSGCMLLFGGLSQPLLTEDDKIGSFVHYYDAACQVWGGLCKLPEPRFDAAACVLRNGVYLSGGIDHRSNNAELRSTKNTWYLDLRRWTWQKRSNMPRKRSGHSLVALDNLVYAIGGAADLQGNGLTAAVDVYNPESDQWTSAAPLPVPLWKMAAATHRNRLWVCGGYTKTLKTSPCSGSVAERLVSDVYVFKPKYKTWFSAQRLPQGRAMASLVVLSGRLILIGGIISSFDQRLATTELSIYCGRTRKWSHLDNMTVPRCCFSAVATTDNKIVILGGRVGPNGAPLSHVELYDFESGQWMDSAYPLPLPLSNSAVVCLATECNQHLLRHICP